MTSSGADDPDLIWAPPGSKVVTYCHDCSTRELCASNGCHPRKYHAGHALFPAIWAPPGSQVVTYCHDCRRQPLCARKGCRRNA